MDKTVEEAEDDQEADEEESVFFTSGEVSDTVEEEDRTGLLEEGTVAIVGYQRNTETALSVCTTSRKQTKKRKKKMDTGTGTKIIVCDTLYKLRYRMNNN